MNSRKRRNAIALSLFATLVLPLSITAQTGKVNNTHHHYQVVQIPTLGGAETVFFDNANNVAVLNGSGAASGGCAGTLLSDPYQSFYWWNLDGTVCHAFVWNNGSITDLGSLPGANNSGSTWISSNGIVAGLSENGQIDPSVAGLPQDSAVMWRGGKVIDLGTLPGGGYQSAAVSVNNRGEVAGVATNLVPDANSLFPYNPNLWSTLPYGYQLRAFIWDEKHGMQDLGTLGTGTDAQAIKINNLGQVIGDSYTSSNPGVCFPATMGAFIWDRQHGMRDLGTFGGSCIEPFDINDLGQVVGSGVLTGDVNQRAFLWQNGSLRDFGGSIGGKSTGAYVGNQEGHAAGFATLRGEGTFHAALWKRVGRMTDLGTIGTDPCSFALGMNDKDQVVGNSTPSDCANFDTSRGFIWENGSIADLNALVPASSPLYIIYAYTINNRGEIAVNGIDGSGIEQAALLVPCDENHAGVQGCDYSMVEATVADVPTTPEVRCAAGRTLPQSRLRRTDRRHLPGEMQGRAMALRNRATR